MLRHNVENDSNEQDAVELSRRSFFSRLAVGTVLSIAMPGVVHAAKSASVKDDKKHRSAKTAVRLPKKSAKVAKAGHGTPKGSASHVSAKQRKLAAAKTGKLADSSHKASATNHVQHNARVRDVYTGKNQGNHAVKHQANNSQGGRTHSVIRPGHKAPLIESAQEPLIIADHGRFSTHRALSFQNPHTGDKLSLTYFEKGRYLSDALEEINFLLRDYRTGDVHAIDPALLDQLHDLKQMLGLQQPFDIICGYRSPLTNARLHAERAGVANNSFHIHGRAVDIRIERFDLRRIHNAALAMHSGGVGYYPGSNFIHLDTGTFRTWTL